MTIKRVRAHHLAQMKAEGTPITMLTSYDAITTRIFDEAGTDMLLVGDSYANVMLGFDSTTQVGIDEMVLATSAVARVARRAFVVADLPFGSYETSPADAVANAVKLIRAGASAVKLEGGVRMAPTIEAIVRAGINVVAHIGYTPQSENALGGPRVQGRGDSADQVRKDAVAVAEAGAIAVVLELVPAAVATQITKDLAIPTIGIGAGEHTDGQVLVWTDMAGMTDWQPSFVKVFGDVGQELKKAALAYNAAVRARTFPDDQHRFND
ncbi:3-methyl-2-oxobutanoate hydroxymethyltransferase [Arcanobacterium pinnipediorum]|uniref:3-methyl-2-oxobutanoate hydroxymethyltransferase n=1 Tax=Arcanobacterium pinnipediorum TaxID=1503041 RepID=A0ABY5AIP0_9ACTO|nr:3-methyl-2-oxobutanoate hydroxymethyltransferase [Arcanobacterium pinnipediorum]USR80087.1 3-methyl-2-oxobutanoate hydroxymethyltransferase [Arcanobacterium pinnipediorum]